MYVVKFKVAVVNSVPDVVFKVVSNVGVPLPAAAQLVEMSGGNIAAFIFAINLFDLNGSNNLVKKGYYVENLMDFPGH